MWFNHSIQNAFYRARLFGAKFFCIGYSTLGKPILCTHIGNKIGPQILVHGAIHAREYITTLLVCRQIEYCLKNFKGIGGIYFVPLLNPDGVDIAINGTENLYPECRKENIKGNYKLFKANANLVDLNVNFDADWGRGKTNILKAASENYIGRQPHSEREVRVIAAFTRKIRPAFTISYHCKGEELYYKFHQRGRKNKLHKAIAKRAADICGYPIKNTKGSTGGFKDYCVQKLGIPSVTIEVGSDKLSHPLGIECLPKILTQQLKLPLLMLENFVRCDILLSCLMKQKNKDLCALRYWKQIVRQEKAKCQSEL